VLSFSTSVDMAVSRGAVIFTYQWRDETAYEFARSVGADVADRSNKDGFTLSPVSLIGIQAGKRLVLPSPNGSTICFAVGGATLLLGCLRNRKAVAEFAADNAKTIAIVPAGEQWDDGTPRPCFEDLLGAGAIITLLSDNRSPEAEAAASVFNSFAGQLVGRLKGSVSGREKIERNEVRDIELAAELDTSTCVPLLKDSAFVNATADVTV
jgi:2-phosphosulfolactate phosphatase